MAKQLAAMSYTREYAPSSSHMSQYQSTQDSGYNLSTEQLVLDWRKYISPEKRSRMPSMTDLLFHI